MSRSKWKYLAANTAVCMLVGALGVGGTIAYMTDNEAATNTFTVGKIDVDLTEPNYPGNDSTDVKDLVPNQEVKKDPQVANVGVNDAIVFMTVEVPVKDVTTVNADGTKGAKEMTELFWLKDAADSQGTFANHFSDQWMELTAKGEKDAAVGETNRYVFAYKTAVAKDVVTDNLFDKIQLKNIIEGEVAGEAQNVVVNTYAIQASEVLEGDVDLTDALTEENLGKIYDIYFNQNPNQGQEQGGGSEEGPEVKQGTATLIEGPDFNHAMETLSGDLSKVQSVKNADAIPEDAEIQVVSAAGSEKEAVMYFDEESGTIYIATNAEKISLSEQSNNMFRSCTALTDIATLEKWDTGKVTDMTNMFYECSSLANIDALANWNTSNITSMTAMFYHCDALTNLNALANWRTGNVYSMVEMFRDCNIEDASGINNWDIWNVTSFQYMFLNNPTHPKFLTALGTWDSEGTFVRRHGSASLVDGQSFYQTMDVIAGDVNNICSIKYTDEKPYDPNDLYTYMISDYKSEQEIVAYFDEETGTVFLSTDAAEIYLNEDSSSMFEGWSSLTDIEALYNWNTENVTNMESMFGGCSSLENINVLSNWNTGNVTNMKEMFDSCDSLSSLEPLANWDVSSVYSMFNMFTECSSISSTYGLNQWDVRNVNDMTGMFSYCTKLESIESLYDWNPINTVSMDYMFMNCSSLSNANSVSMWDVANVMSFSGMFEGCAMDEYSYPPFYNRPGFWENGTYRPNDNLS